MSDNIDLMLASRRLKRMEEPLGSILETKDDNTPIKMRSFNEESKKADEYTTFDGGKRYAVDDDVHRRLRFNREKARLTFYRKLDILREEYPHMKILKERGEEEISLDDFTLDELKEYFEECIRRVTVANAMNKNRPYLITLWLITEAVGVFFLKVPCKGYTKSQLKNYDSYSLILSEMGEKAAGQPGVMDGMNVYVKLLGVSMANVLFITFINFVAQKLGVNGEGMGSDLITMINQYLNSGAVGDEKMRRVNEANNYNPNPDPIPESNSNGDGLVNTITSALGNNTVGNIINGLIDGGGLGNLFGGGGKRDAKKKSPTGWTRRRRERK